VSREERGAVTAETAVVLPLLVAVTLAMIWLVAVGLAQMRATDAAREAARAVARGDSVARAEVLARQAAPGIGVQVVRSDGEVRVVVDQRLAPPEGVLGHLPGAGVHAEATALVEDAGSGAVP
jgi:Flp pilus assembly protein TadG